MRNALVIVLRGGAVLIAASGTVAAKAVFGTERAAVLRPSAGATRGLVAPVQTTTTLVAVDGNAATPVVAASDVVSDAPAAATTTTLGRRLVSGDIADTEYGPLQVALVVDGDRIVDVQTLEYPRSSERSREINDPALPVLRQSVIDAQSSDIQTISGATVTYEAYKLSVQSALDNA